MDTHSMDTHMTRRPDFWFGVAAIAVSAGLFVQTMGLPPSVVPNSIGSAAFPRILLALMAAMGLALILRAARAPASPERARTPAAAPEPADDAALAAERASEAKPGGYARPLVLFAGLLVYLAALPALGYYLATALTLAGTLLLFGERRWAAILLGVGCFLAFTFLVFDTLLGVLLPRNPFFAVG